MAKPFDATTKRLIETQPEAWLRLAGLLKPGEPVPPVRVVNTDVSTVSAAADYVIRVETVEPYLAHLELETSYRPEHPKRYRFYNEQLCYVGDMHVKTVVLLLRRDADGPAMSGRLTRGSAAEEDLADFRFRVVRVFDLDPERLLTGDLATLPLAPIAAVKPRDLPEVVRRVEDRLSQEPDTTLAKDLWAATYVLLGLNHKRSFIEQLLKGIRRMRDSDTYMAILEEGEAKGRAEGRAEGQTLGRSEEARRILLRIGEKRFGPPDSATRTRIESMTALDELEALSLRVIEVESWAELLS